MILANLATAALRCTLRQFLVAGSPTAMALAPSGMILPKYLTVWSRHISSTILKRNLATTGTNNMNSFSVGQCVNLESRTVPEYVGSPHLKLHNVVWRSPLQNIYIVKKPWNKAALDAMMELIGFIHRDYPQVKVIVSQDVAEELFEAGKARGGPDGQNIAVYTGTVEEIVGKTDLIVTLGGDGTTLRAVAAFLNGIVPPVLSFAMGTLGFLLPFDFGTYQETFKTVFESKSKAIHRSRLECHVMRRNEGHPAEKSKESEEALEEMVEQYKIAHYKQHLSGVMLHAMNDISLHRGLQPNLILLDIFIDNEFVTTTTSDGIIFASPTGSTAYSLSAGGSITHPLVPCILLTPVCPRSLSFRPLILPSTSHIMIRLTETNRNGLIKLNIDGIPQQDLKPGDEIHVVSENGTIFIPGEHQPPSALLNRVEYDEYIEPGINNEIRGRGGLEVPKGLFCISKTENDWIKGINQLLGFNSSFRGLKV